MATIDFTNRIELDDYTPEDPHFGAPYLDEDEHWDSPPHRMLHGGFEGTDTRFRLHFPPPDVYQGRLFAPLFGGNGGSEDGFNTELVAGGGGMSSSFRLGAYMIQTNQGHIGDTMDPKAGEDATVYGFRATNEVARLSKFIAAQIYGEEPHHAYVFGGSGGGQRTPNCFENDQDLWDGALPFCGGGQVAEWGEHLQRLQVAPLNIPFVLNVQRVLGDRLADVEDAVAPGGSGDPYAGLTTQQREELARIYTLGFPRGDEAVIGAPTGTMWYFAANADLMYEQDPDYFDNFFSTPGYAGHDDPGVAGDRIDTTATVVRVLAGRDVLEDPQFDGDEHGFFRMFAGIFGTMAVGDGEPVPSIVELEGVGAGYRLGAGIRILTGDGAGRQLYAMAVDGNFFLLDGTGENNIRRVGGVRPGDTVQVDNRRFLAYCYYGRHHVMDMPQFKSLRVAGATFYPQHPIPIQSPLVGVRHSGKFHNKMLWVHNTHDYSLWPSSAVTYHEWVRHVQGEAAAREHFRLRWTENAEHGPPMMVAPNPRRQPNTWLVDYGPVIEQSLQDLIDWVERGIEPSDTAYDFSDGTLTLPPTAAERGGIQPVVTVTANGETRADAKVGETLTLAAHAEVPPGAGTVVSVDWDFDGSGTYPLRASGIDGTDAVVDATTTYTYDEPGTYFVTALVHSHREGDVDGVARHIPNLAQCRVVVT